MRSACAGFNIDNHAMRPVSAAFCSAVAPFVFWWCASSRRLRRSVRGSPSTVFTVTPAGFCAVNEQVDHRRVISR